MKSKRRIVIALMLVLLIGNVITAYAADDEKSTRFTDNGGRSQTMTGETGAIWYWGTDWCVSTTRSDSYDIYHSVSLFAYKNNKVKNGTISQNNQLFPTGYYGALTSMNAKADKFVGKHWVSRKQNGVRIAYVETVDKN